MRRHPWAAMVLTLLAVLAGGRNAYAQYADEDEDGGRIRLAAQAQPNPYEYGGYRVPDEYGPPQYDPYAGAGYPPGLSGPGYNSPIDAQNMPPGAQPWPGISPFMEGQFNQHRNERGLWFEDSNSRGIKYHFSMSYAYGKLKRPNDELVSSPDPTIPPVTPTLPQGFSPKTTGELFRSDANTGGIDMRWGYENPDDSGFGLRALWLTDVKTNHHKGTGAGDFNNPQFLFDNGGIAWNGTGRRAAYDRYFNLTYNQQMAQGAFDFSRTPWFKGEFYSVAPMWGARYLFVNEKFAFNGSDSNLTYLYTEYGPITVGSQGPNPNGIPAYEAFFRSEVETHLFGPHLGLKYNIGGEYLKLGGYTQGALLGNIENLSLKGRNLGDGFNTDFRFVDTFFSQKLRNSHVSPAFEQHFYAEAPLFRLVPYLNKWNILKEAKVRAAYTYLSVGEVSRPESNIIYNGFPGVPELRTSRGEWHTSVYSIGVDWLY
ncbi:MAG: hypothetical protein IT428_08960 [Planctomycetaceae bacterium]|nr:hypothetical protein [Planctomycetaceae bacterium]